MARAKRRMILCALNRGMGVHPGGWRHSSVKPETLREVWKLSHYAKIAEACEASKMHFIFIADSPVVKYMFNPALLRRHAQDNYLEPLTLISALAAVTRNVGLVTTASTTYNEPYNVARMLASLDHLSGGRAGWNIVTSTEPDIAHNYSKGGLPTKDSRYDRAEDFVRVVRGLWDSFEDDTFVLDQKSGTFLDPSKTHFLNFKSDNMSVRGPMNMARCPQGHPVLLVAGSSESGRNLAAEVGELMFTAQPNLTDAQRFYSDLKGRTAKFGRTPQDLSILPGVEIVVGRTMAEAREKHAYLKSFIDEEYAIQYLSDLCKVDLTPFPADQPPPESLRNPGVWSRVDLVMDIARREGLTLGQVAVRFADQYGHNFVVGDVSSVADELQTWFESGAADGFVIMPTHFPEGLDDVLTLVVPELQARGLFRTEFEGSTFRENLGLKRPPHRKPESYWRQST